MLGQISERFEQLHISFSDHTKRAKRRMSLGVMNAKNKRVRKKQYEDLLKVTHKTLEYGQNAASLLDTIPSKNPSAALRAQGMAEEPERSYPIDS